MGPSSRRKAREEFFASLETVLIENDAVMVRIAITTPLHH